MPRSPQSALQDAVDEKIGMDSGNGRGLLPDVEATDRLLAITWALWNERRQIMRIAAGVALAVLLIGILTPTMYLSSTSLMPPDNQNASGLAGMAALANRLPASDLGFKGDLLSLPSTGDLFVGILRSRTAQERIVEQFDLRRVYGHPWLHWRSSEQDARSELERNTEISAERKSGIITISVVDHDRNRAAAMAKSYVDQLNRLESSLNTSTARREREFLEQRLGQVKKDLDSASHQLSEFSSQSRTFDPKDEAQTLAGAAATLQGELIAAEAQLKGLEPIYAPNNVRIRSLQSRIAELRRRLQQVSRGASGKLSEDVGDAASDMPFPSLRQLPILGMTYSDLYRRAKIQETVFQVLTQQYEAARVQEAKEIPIVRELDVAEVPEKKFGPHRILMTLLGGAAGLLLGCAWVIGRAEWERLGTRNPYNELAAEIAAAAKKQWLWKRVESVLSLFRRAAN